MILTFVSVDEIQLAGFTSVHVDTSCKNAFQRSLARAGPDQLTGANNSETILRLFALTDQTVKNFCLHAHEF